LDAVRIEPNATEPVPRRTTLGVRCLGELRLPLAGPYRPRARLYRLPSGELRWLVRLWEIDHVAPRFVMTADLRRFAKENRLPALARAIEELVARASVAEDDGAA